MLNFKTSKVMNRWINVTLCLCVWIFQVECSRKFVDPFQRQKTRDENAESFVLLVRTSTADLLSNPMSTEALLSNPIGMKVERDLKSESYIGSDGLLKNPVIFLQWLVKKTATDISLPKFHPVIFLQWLVEEAATDIILPQMRENLNLCVPEKRIVVEALSDIKVTLPCRRPYPIFSVTGLKFYVMSRRGGSLDYVFSFNCRDDYKFHLTFHIQPVSNEPWKIESISIDIWIDALQTLFCNNRVLDIDTDSKHEQIPLEAIESTRQGSLQCTIM